MEMEREIIGGKVKESPEINGRDISQSNEDKFRENLLQKLKIINNLESQRIYKTIVLFFSYPKLDSKVTKGIEHLVKAPLMIHPTTNYVCSYISDPKTFSFQDIVNKSINVDLINKQIDELSLILS